MNQAFQNLLTIGILGSIFILIYCGIRRMSLVDVIKEIIDQFKQL